MFLRRPRIIKNGNFQERIYQNIAMVYCHRQKDIELNRLFADFVLVRTAGSNTVLAVSLVPMVFSDKPRGNFAARGELLLARARGLSHMQRGVRDSVLARETVRRCQLCCALLPGHRAVPNAGNHQGRKHQEGIVAPSSLFTLSQHLVVTDMSAGGAPSAERCSGQCAGTQGNVQTPVALCPSVRQSGGVSCRKSSWRKHQEDVLAASSLFQLCTVCHIP